MKTIWVRTALLFFFIAACIGALMRWAFVAEVEWLEFRYFMYAHSHLAMLGWVFLMLFTFLIHSFLDEEQQNRKIYSILFSLMVISCTGMLISFPIQGYGIWSISFSSLHVLVSYVFVWSFWKDLAKKKMINSPSIRFVKTALIFMVISTFALWAMAPLMVSELRGSALYYATVQFYLHFQFNGWFIFTVLGLFFKILENHNVNLPKKIINTFYILLVISCFLTFALAVAWSKPLPIVFWINSIGVAIQLLALVSFVIFINKIFPDLKSLFSGKAKLLLGVAFLCFILKILMQSAVIIPSMATIAYTIRNFVIGFIHLVLLGVMSHFIFGYAKINGLIKLETKLSKAGIYLFIISFFLTEFTLFVQGLLLWFAIGFVPFYYEGLFVISALLPLSILMILAGEITQRNNSIR
jgi:hypothetical protein